MIVLERKCVIWKITNGEIVEIRIGNEVFKKSYIIDTLPVKTERKNVNWNKYTEMVNLQKTIREHEKRAGEKHVYSGVDIKKETKPKKPEIQKKKRGRVEGSGRKSLIEKYNNNNPQ